MSVCLSVCLSFKYALNINPILLYQSRWYVKILFTFFPEKKKVKQEKGDVLVLKVKDYNDTIYNNINCSDEQLMVKSAVWEGNHSIWVSQHLQ